MKLIPSRRDGIRLLEAFALCLALSAYPGVCSAGANSNPTGSKQRREESAPLANPQKPQLGGLISEISLIANPARYDGKHVVVEGYLTVGFEDTFLWLSPYDAQVFAISNALALAFTKDQMKQWRMFDHQPVQIDGTFWFPKVGSFGPCPNGALIKVKGVSSLLRLAPGVDQ